jgi:4-oxalocrotonate tautomerase
MPTVHIEWFAGRTQEQKEDLAAAITDAVSRIAKVPADATNIVFTDVDKSNWAKGGVMVSNT